MNIIDYVIKNKQTFDKSPFNEVDSLVLCELSYLNFTKELAGAPTVSLKELCLHSDELVKDTLLPKSNAKLLNAIAQSPRFSPVKAGYFRERNSVEEETRFAAITFELTPELNYIAYRGTDITLLGWKEDFNMAILKTIPSQKLALEYLQEVAPKLSGKLLLGGHSKGGNLVVYAGVFGFDEFRDKIVAIYDHDGPGFKEDFFPQESYNAVLPLVNKTVPHDSIIGMLFKTVENYKVVASTSLSVMQHNPFSWKVTPQMRFKKLPKTARTSVVTEVTLTKWIAELDEPTTQKLVDAMFAVVYGSGAQTVPELLHHPLRCIVGMKKAFRDLDEEGKQLLSSNGKELLKLWFSSLRQFEE